MSKVPPDGNVVLIAGTVQHPPEWRERSDGVSLLSFDLAVREPGRPTDVVPVSWPDPPANAVVEADTAVVVLGRVRRRFFRVGGATQSRTEVMADHVVPRRRRSRAASLGDDAAQRLAALFGATGSTA
jgi:single-strand DNA-binding protein